MKYKTCCLCYRLKECGLRDIGLRHIADGINRDLLETTQVRTHLLFHPTSVHAYPVTLLVMTSSYQMVFIVHL